jgi:hypothetical protein
VVGAHIGARADFGPVFGRLSCKSCRGPKPPSLKTLRNLRNGQSVVANCVNILPWDLGGRVASVSLDAPVAARHQKHSRYRHDHACCARGCPIGSDRGHGTCRRCISSTAPGATELAHTRMYDRCRLWPGTSFPHLTVAVTPNSALHRHSSPTLLHPRTLQSHVRLQPAGLGSVTPANRHVHNSPR